MQLPEGFPEYAGMTVLAAIGSIARGKQWFDPETGRFVVAKFVTEAATAIGLGVVIVSVGATWHVELPVLCGICVGAGWLGPESVSRLVMGRLGIKS